MKSLAEILADPRGTGELLALAVADCVRICDAADDCHSLAGHDALVVLQARGTQEVLDGALLLCGSVDPKQRMLGALILGQLGSPERTFPDACCDRLLRLLKEDAEQDVQEMAMFALGHLGNRRADGEILHFIDHPSDEMRHGLAFALVGATRQDTVAVLLRLMRDRYALARDWATTSIGDTLELDGHDIRAALVDRISDEDEATRAEAHLGLARRHEAGIVTPLIGELEHRFGEPTSGHDANYNHHYLDAAKIYLGMDENTVLDGLLLAHMLRTSVGT